MLNILQRSHIILFFINFTHSCQRSINTVFEMHCLKPIRGPEFQLSKSRASELDRESARFQTFYCDNQAPS